MQLNSPLSVDDGGFGNCTSTLSVCGNLTDHQILLFIATLEDTLNQVQYHPLFTLMTLFCPIRVFAHTRMGYPIRVYSYGMPIRV